MVTSRGLRQQQAANAHAAEHDDFAAMLLAAFEDPEFTDAVFSLPAVAEAVAGIAETVMRPARQRRTGPQVTSASAARQLKTARLAQRGRGVRHG